MRTPHRRSYFFQVRQITQSHGELLEVVEVVEEPEDLLLKCTHFHGVHARIDGGVDGRDHAGNLHVTVADGGTSRHVKPRRLGLAGLDGLSPLVFRSLAVPSDLGRLVFAVKDDPGVILGQSQVHVVDFKQLARGHHRIGHAETVKLVACQIAVDGL